MMKANLRRAEGGHPPVFHLAALAKYAVLFLLLLLGILGYQGRQQARLQVRIQDILDVGDQITEMLEEEQGRNSSLAAVVEGRPGAIQSTNRQFTLLLNALRGGLERFESDFKPSQLSEVQRMELALSKGLLANKEQRFEEALRAVTQDDEARPGSGPGQRARLLRALRIRGEGFYGLSQWPEAARCYQRLLELAPGQILARARLAECFRAMGKPAESQAAWEELARNRMSLGDILVHRGKLESALDQYEQAGSLLAQLIEKEAKKDLQIDLGTCLANQGCVLVLLGKATAAVAHYLSAAELQVRLLEQGFSDDLAAALARSYRYRGDAFLVLGNPGAGLDQYRKSLEILTRLVEQRGRNELAADLAMNFAAQGSALLGQQKLDAAIERYRTGIEIETRLVEREGRRDLLSDLAIMMNNRGAAYRAQGKLDSAVADFDNSARLLTGLEQSGESKAWGGETNNLAFRPIQLRLDIALKYSENAIQVLTGIRLVQPGVRRDPEVALAIILENRAYAYLAEGKLDLALADFSSTIAIYSRLVGEKGQMELSPQFAENLAAAASVYGAHPNPAVRNGRKAEQYAVRACQLTEWKSWLPVSALAVAHAETGNFAEAVKWQERSLELAPRGNKAQLQARLLLYKSGKPYRLSSATKE